MWWTDISNPRVPDFESRVYDRTFVEDRTGFAIVTYSADKTTQTLVRHLQVDHRQRTGRQPSAPVV